MKLYACKYPVVIGWNEGDPICLPVGTLFKIVGIDGNWFQLQPLKKPTNPDHDVLSITADPQMLTVGYEETDVSELQEKSP